ncbi:MAG: hypothetical protein AAGF10_06085 [Verrucomicrobiota bacterium]
MQASENTKFMEWQFNPPARHSSVSGTAFAEGEVVTCVLYINMEGQLERADLQEAELASFNAPGGVLGRWRREVKTPDEEAKEARAQLMATTEELFLSLFENEEEAGQSERATLKQLLALMLERKRLLKRVGPTKEGMQVYVRPKHEEEYHVAMEEMAPERLLAVQEQLKLLV